MKALWLIFTICVFDSTLSGQSTHDLAAMLGEHEGGQLQLAKQIASASEEKRNTLISKVVQMVTEIANNPLPHRNQENFLISQAAYVLKAAKDERASLDAFAVNLERLGYSGEVDAVEVLALCYDPKAVAAIETLARKRMESLPRNLPLSPSEEFSRDINENGASFTFMLKGLTSSVNPTGKEIAASILDEFAQKFGSTPEWKPLLDHLNIVISPRARIDSKGADSDDSTAMLSVKETKVKHGEKSAISAQFSSNRDGLVWLLVVIAATVSAVWVFLRKSK